MQGNFFEDLYLGRRFRHATARTITDGEVALHIAFTGARQPCGSSTPLAKGLGYRDRPVDDILVFNIAFGKTVPDISMNAVANLGYAGLRFLAPVYVGDTVRAESEVVGRREISNGTSGIVYVSTRAFNQSEACVLEFVRWVLVRKRNVGEPSPEAHVPELPSATSPEGLIVPDVSGVRSLMAEATGCAQTWSDYRPGQRIDHPSGMTIDASDHTLATKLYQNTGKAHFDAMMMNGERLVYGGHVISVCRALSYDGLENILNIAAINAGTHVSPTYAGDTIYCATEVIECFSVPHSSELGGLRLRLWGIKNQRPESVDFGRLKQASGPEAKALVLDLDYVALMPV